MNEIVIKTDRLTKVFGHTVALDQASIEIKRGSIVGLVGKNGAGKTTLIKLLCGLIRPTDGTFSVLEGERDATSVAAIIEKPSLYLGLNARDNLAMQSKLLGLPVDENRIAELLKEVGLTVDNKKPANNYSLGMKQRLAIAMALVGNPKLLILDEPTNGLDPEGIVEIRNVLEKMNRENGVTIIVSSHILSELSKLATDYVFLNKGKVVACATAEQLHKSVTKRTRLTLSDYDVAEQALEGICKTERGKGYLDLIGEVPTSEMFAALSQANVDVYSVNSVGDDLENFFVSMLKAEKEGK